MIKFYSCLKIKLPVAIEPAKVLNVFEIALQFFQEYAESMEFSLNFKDFVQELKFLPGKYTVPRGFIFLARNKSVRVGCEAFCPVV